MYGPDDSAAEETGGQPSRDCAGSTDNGVGAGADGSNNNGTVDDMGCSGGEGCMTGSGGNASTGGS
jgi:hypothetical protein